jgi:hypothetical protein
MARSHCNELENLILETVTAYAERGLVDEFLFDLTWALNKREQYHLDQARFYEGTIRRFRVEDVKTDLD